MRVDTIAVPSPNSNCESDGDVEESPIIRLFKCDECVGAQFEAMAMQSFLADFGERKITKSPQKWMMGVHVSLKE